MTTLNAQNHVDLSSGDMRRDVSRGIVGPPDGSAVGGLVSIHTQPPALYAAVLEGVLTPAPPPPAVPVEDPTQHATVAAGSGRRLLIRPAANLYQPELVYEGVSPQVVRV